ALRPAKLWCDTESAAENRELLEALGGPAGSLERLGLVLAPGYTLSKLLWSRRRFPELFARVAHILLPHDYLNHWLTGRVCSEAGDASGSGYFDDYLAGGRYPLALIRDTHVSPSLPQA
ncbi:FGGY family carbohydrate kinase, partial [Pseudomonas aeruginosa]|nr:FGGY family carbohydrate kinase [Pseudomonas aeruginosa]